MSAASSIVSFLKLPNGSPLFTLSVGSICEMVGYSNVSYFCQIFKNHCGMTPAQFRGSKL